VKPYGEYTSTLPYLKIVCWWPDDGLNDRNM